VTAQYLIRLDDACDTMHRANWQRMEQVLDEHRIRPIVAVVAENGDPTLKCNAARDDFWDTVRAWQAKGWSIGLHGHTHEMHPTDAALVLPYYARSEFAGLPLERQADKIRIAWRKFSAERLEPRIWVAPAHSFDWLTLEAVRQETPIRIVSDGIAWAPFLEREFHWIPQQLWGFSERRSGVWTVCLHPNTMNEKSFAALAAALERYRGRMACVEDVHLSRRRKSLRSRMYARYFWWRWRQAARRAGRR
jgi:predicted deacetylase